MKKALIWILTLSLLLSALPTWGVTLAAETEKTVQIAPTLSGTEPALELVPEDTLVWAADSPILRHIDAQVLESGTHVARLPEEESLNSYVFRNQDGSATSYILDEPVKFVDSSGVIQEKDLTLMSVTGGYTTARNDVALTLPNNPISGIGLQYKDSNILLIPQGGMSRSIPQRSDNSITYSNYFGNGISLRYTPTLSGVKEDIILAAYTGVNQFTFLLNTGGMGLFEANGRYYIAQSEQSEERITLSDIVTFDARGRFHLGSTAVETLTDRQSYRLTITVDDAFLTDPNTTYPVMIDPTLTVNYDVYGANAIEDASIYSGYPNTNGDWVYLHAGYYDSNYKIARTLVRLPGLLRSSVYGDPDNFNITTVNFHIREATGTTPIAVRLYANTGSSTWVESSVTWNNAGVVLGSQYATASPKYGSDTIYDITSLVKAWQKGTLNAASGFVLRNSNETSSDKAFYSAEYSSTSYRPYVEVNYTYTSGSLNTTSCSINEGSTRTLSVSGLSGTVTWSSSNSSVASVNSSGVVTAIKAGTVTITVLVPNYTPLKCTVYVTKPSGVYRIKNNAANYYLGTSGSIAERTYTELVSKTSAGPAQLYQLWKITYLGTGYYSIRPLYKLDMGLYLNLYHATLYSLTTSDSLNDVTPTAHWLINSDSLGYTIQYRASSGLVMAPNDDALTNGTPVMVDTYSATNTARHWTLERVSSPTTGSCWYDLQKQCCTSFTNFTRILVYGAETTLADCGMMPIVYSLTSNNQQLDWISQNPEIAAVNSSTGAITGLQSGTTTIVGTPKNGTSANLTITVHVIGSDQYALGVRTATIDGTQYYDYTTPINALFASAVTECYTNRCKNSTQYTPPVDYSVVLTHQLASFLWFYRQVNHGARWDLKLESCWNEALPGIPYLGLATEFVFRGYKVTAEGIGNIMYGYTGRATGFGEITLYWGGGVAKQGSASCEEVTTPPLYGDDQNDHDNVKLGYDMFLADYPDYPHVGYDGIPLDEWTSQIADIILDPGT